jgi:inner membrane protein involved in colicin E2 resistance
MTRRIIAIIFIFICTTIAWMILGATIFNRSQSFDSSLKNRVVSTWGTAQTQTPPSASYSTTSVEMVDRIVDGKPVTERANKVVRHPLPLQQSDVNVDLNLEHRQKGLLWYSTYKVDFGGIYKFQNNTGTPQDVRIEMRFPSESAIYDNFNVTVDGQPVPVTNTNNAAVVDVNIPAGQTITYAAAYRSQGLDTWTYRFGDEVTQVRDFSLQMTTNFKDIDFPENTISPSEKSPTASGWQLAWRYKSLLSGFNIGMAMPEKLQPGPLAGQISFFAPVSLFFFFFLMFIITTLRGIELHPMNYFFLATAFFAFHLLMAYLVDHISIHAAFIICSLVSIFLVVTYLRLVVGMRFAAVEAGISQFIYLVLFSYAFFFKGFTGLAVTIGSILTLFVVMQMTGKIRWADKFAPSTPGPRTNGVGARPAGSFLD